MQNQKRDYKKFEESKREALIFLVFKQGLKIKEATQDLDVKFAVAKTIVVVFTFKSKISVDYQKLQIVAQNQLNNCSSYYQQNWRRMCKCKSYVKLKIYFLLFFFQIETSIPCKYILFIEINTSFGNQNLQQKMTIINYCFYVSCKSLFFYCLIKEKEHPLCKFIQLNEQQQKSKKKAKNQGSQRNLKFKIYFQILTQNLLIPTQFNLIKISNPILGFLVYNLFYQFKDCTQMIFAYISKEFSYISLMEIILQDKKIKFWNSDKTSSLIELILSLGLLRAIINVGKPLRI